MGESSHSTSKESSIRYKKAKAQQSEDHQDLSLELRLSFNLWGRKGEREPNDPEFIELMALEDPYFLPGVNPEDITIGVELEMILLNTWGIDAFKLVRNSLRDLADDLNTSAPPLKSFLQKEPNTPTKDPFTIFQVKTDPTISCTQWDKRGIYTTAVEVATPILRNETWKWVIPSMCRAITSLTAPNFMIHPAFNSSTGLHVHIGLGRPYTLAELKRIAKAVILFERQMDKYHPKCRIPEDDLGSCFRSCRGSLALKGLSNSGMIGVIDRCRTTEDLLCAINGLGRDRSYQRFYRYNFLPVLTYGTIEFRQAMATNNAQWILNWIAVVIKFVTMAVKTSDETYLGWAKAVDVPPKVFGVFGVPSPAGYGKSRGVVKRKRRVPMLYRLSRRKKNVYLSKQGRQKGCARRPRYTCR